MGAADAAGEAGDDRVGAELLRRDWARMREAARAAAALLAGRYGGGPNSTRLWRAARGGCRRPARRSAGAESEGGGEAAAAAVLEAVEQALEVGDAGTECGRSGTVSLHGRCRDEVWALLL